MLPDEVTSNLKSLTIFHQFSLLLPVPWSSTLEVQIHRASVPFLLCLCSIRGEIGNSNEIDKGEEQII